MSPYLIPDATLSLAAVVGMVAMLWHLEQTGARDALSARYRAILLAAAVFQGARVLLWFDIVVPFRFLTYLTAALLPLLALLLTEGLLRRHAPVWAKIFVGGGAGLLGFAAAIPALTGSFGHLLALLLYQLATFLFIGWIIWRRDRDSLTDEENRRIGWMALSLIFILPFLASDYRLDWAPIPVRLSALAILVTCWLSLWRPVPGGPSNPLWTLGAMAVLATAAALAISAQAGLSSYVTWQVGAVVVALLVLFDMVRRAVTLRAETRASALLTRLATAAERPLPEFMDDLTDAASEEGVLVLREEALSGFDPGRLAASLHATGRVRQSDLPSDAAGDTRAQSSARLLLERYGASHLYLLSETPPAIAVWRPAGLGADGPTPGLRAAFAMSRLRTRPAGARSP